MSFEKKKIVKSTSSSRKKPIARKPTRVRKKSPQKRRWSVGARKKKKSVIFTQRIRNIVLFLVMFFVLWWIIGWFALYQKYLADLPWTQELKDLEIAETSIIYDKDGGELYNVFVEKRTYVDFSKISDNIVNALIAWEDQRYWENSGIDPIGLSRAAINYVTGKTDQVKWTSTVTQQLISNTIIWNERKIATKIQEMYLSWKITKDLSKERILELYLNKISFGWNAYGIEQAARTFFWVSAADVSVLQASILASLPKGPSYYSPYSNPDRLLWYPYVYSKEDTEAVTKIMTEWEIVENNEKIEKLKTFIDGLKLKRLTDSKALICGLSEENVKKHISIDRDGCSVVAYDKLLVLLNGIRIEDWESVIEYQTGRKDFILQRMLEDRYIEFDDYKASLLGAFWYKFNEYKEDIKYPHFVFYVKEYIEEKYGKDLLEKGWLRIYTTLDPKLQDEAERIVEKYWAANEAKYGAKNSALVSIENKTWKVLAMVWGRDYFDKENKWNVNITTSRLQPGSSFKPFVYALAFDQQRIGTKTPVYDLETKFPWDYTPWNFDGKFKGKMTIMEALNTSRNIPAVKMFFVAGGENKILNFLETLWVNTPSNFKKEYLENYGKEYSYWASMALGTWLMTPLELASAYSVFANMWKKVDVNPIEKILDTNGEIIEEFEEKEAAEVINPSLAYIMNYVLSNTSSRPDTWNKFLAMNGRPVAAKTGTSTKQYGTWDDREIFPRNLWTAWYTPQITTIAWSWNTDWKELGPKWSGLQWAWPIWKDFMEFAHKDKAVASWEKTPWIKEVNISRVSWLLPPWSLSWSFITDSLFLNPPETYGRSYIWQVDALCNGLVTEDTPEAAIKNISLLRFSSLRPDNPEWENPVKRWVSNWWYLREFGWLNNNVATYVSSKVCERSSMPSDIILRTSTPDGASFVKWTNFIELAYRSNHPIVRIDIFLGWKSIVQVPLTAGKNEWAYKWSFEVPSTLTGSTTLTIRAVDDQFFSKQETKTINIIDRDTTPPVITLSSPGNNNTIPLSEGIRLNWYITDRSQIKSINIYSDWSPIKIGLEWRSFNYMLRWSDLWAWTHIVEIEAIDNGLNSSRKAITVEVTDDTPQSDSAETEEPQDSDENQTSTWSDSE